MWATLPAPFFFVLTRRKNVDKARSVVYRSKGDWFQAWGQTSEGKIMKKQLVAALLMLGTACAARAQIADPTPRVPTEMWRQILLRRPSERHRLPLLRSGTRRMMPPRLRRPIRSLYTEGGTTSAGSWELALIG